jgi:hypothetical protein
MEVVLNITEILSFTILVAGFIISLIFKKKKNLFPLQLYFVLSLICNSIDIYYNFFDKRGSIHFQNAILNSSSIIEIFIIYLFLYNKIKRLIFRKLIIIFSLVYFTTCIIVWSSGKRLFFEFLPNLFGFEGLLIVAPCLFYICELLKSDLRINLNSDANFVATCGLFFYFSISVPTYFGWVTLYYLSPGYNRILILTILISYILLIVSFIKAYLCPIPSSQQ